MDEYAQKWVRPFRSYGNYQMHLTNDLTNQADWLNDFGKRGDNDQVIFSLVTSLLCVFDICGVSTAVVLVKNDVLLLVPIGIVLELGFPKFFFNKSLIKCGKIVSCLMHYSKKYEKWTET